MSDIYVFGPNDEDNDYASMGLVGALIPTEGTFHEVADGDSEISFSHPLDEFGRYTNLVEGNILTVPVPVRTTPEIQNGTLVTNVWTYKVRDVSAFNAQRTLYKKASGSKRIAIMKPGDTLTVVYKNLKDEKARWKARTKYGTGYIEPNEIVFEMLNEYQLEDKSTAIEEVASPWKVTRQRFRIESVEKKMDGVDVTARHITYDMLYNVTFYKNENEATLGDTITGVIDNCCDQTIKDRFEILTNIANVYAGVDYRKRNPIDAIFNADDGMCSVYKVHVVRDNERIYLLDDPGLNRGVRIQYSKNMQDVTFKSDESGVATRIIPIGEKKNGDPLYLNTNNDPKNSYIDSPIIDRYPTIKVHVLECKNAKAGEKETGGTVSEAVARARMRSQAEELLKAKCDEPKIEMSVKMLNLGDTEEYKAFRGLEDCFLFDYVIVQHPKLGIDITARIMEIEWDFLKDRMKSIKIGSVGKTLANTGITSWQIPTGAIHGSKLASDSIDSRHLISDIIDVRHMQAESVNTEALQANSVTSNKIAANSINASHIQAGVIETNALNAVQAKIQELTAETILTDSFGASMAQIETLIAGTAEFDWETVQHLVAQAMHLEKGVGEQVFIKNLAVEYAQMVGATIGELCIKSSDGGYYLLDIDSATGAVTATQVSPSPEEQGSGHLQTGQVIVESSMTVGDLNTSNLMATFALINKIDAARIDVDQIFARQAFVNALYTSRIYGGKSLQMIAGEVESKADNVNENLFTGTQYFSGDDWIQIVGDWSTIEREDVDNMHFLVKGVWYYACTPTQEIMAKPGESFTLSMYIACASNAQLRFVCEHVAHIDRDETPLADGGFKRISVTFTVDNEGGIIRPRIDNSNRDDGLVHIAALKLERGDQATEWSPSPRDNLSENLYVGTQYFDSDKWEWEYSHIANWPDSGEIYKGFRVKQTDYNWTGLCQPLDAKVGEVYTLSAYIKRDPEAHVWFLAEGTRQHATDLTSQITGEWQRIAVTFKLNHDYRVPARFENIETAGRWYICGIKLERGDQATEWSEAPEDVDKATVYSDVIQPPNPIVGKVWLDQSVIPNVLRRWNGAEWLRINDPQEIWNAQDNLQRQQDAFMEEQKRLAMAFEVKQDGTHLHRAVEIGQTPNMELWTTDSEINFMANNRRSAQFAASYIQMDEQTAIRVTSNGMIFGG